jgi:hypothetical protein
MMNFLRFLGTMGVAVGGSFYLASFYHQQSTWFWSGLAMVGVSLAALAVARFGGGRREPA